jgi:hypothetical protein
VGGIKKAGLNLEPLVNALGGPEQAHTAVEKTAARIQWVRSRFGLARWSRQHESGGAPGLLRFSELQHGYASAVLHEKADWEQSVAEVSAVRSLGSIPLIVISRARELQGLFPPWFPMREIEASWQDMQRDLTTLSSNSKHVFARQSDHLIPYRQPEIIVSSAVGLIGRPSAGNLLSSN